MEFKLWSLCAFVRNLVRCGSGNGMLAQRHKGVDCNHNAIADCQRQRSLHSLRGLNASEVVVIKMFGWSEIFEVTALRAFLEVAQGFGCLRRLLTCQEAGGFFQAGSTKQLHVEIGTEV